MLKRLHLRNFTVFADAEFEFGEGLNVLVGTNGTGKSQVLKVGYVAEIAYQEEAIRQEESNSIIANEEIEANLNKSLFRLLSNVFVVYGLKKLVRQTPLLITNDMQRLQVQAAFKRNSDGAIDFGIDSHAMMLMLHQLSPPVVGRRIEKPILIPAKEALTLGWVLSLYERREIPIDQTYPDLLRLLSGPPLREPKPVHIVEGLEKIIGGKVVEEGGRFYLAVPDQPLLEMDLVAEGMRKFATLYKLLANGTLTPETTLFWDEPEANLNPALLKELAILLTDLAQAGFQIILATHSLFLMKELHILSRQRKQPVRYFGLYAGEKGDVQVERQDDFMQLQHIAALDAELAQTFDFDEVLDQDYAGDS